MLPPTLNKLQKLALQKHDNTKIKDRMATPTQRNRLVPWQNRIYFCANISFTFKFSFNAASKNETIYMNQFNLAYQNIYSLLPQ